MANETELSNFITVGNMVSGLASPALVNASIGMNLVHIEQFPDNTNVIKFRKNGSLTAETLAESTAYSFSGSSELTDSSISCTAVKWAVVSKITAEALRFGTGAASLPRLAQEQGEALARLFDATMLALFSGFSQVVTASSTLTKDNVLDAQYNVYDGKTPPGRLVAVLDYKGANELRKEITSITASAWSNPAMLGIVNNNPKQNNLIGELAGIDIYQTSGLPTTGGDDIGAVFHPQWAFCCGIGGAIETNVSPFKASEGFWYEISSHMFCDIKEWNDRAGSGLRSDT